ncbi:phenylacetate-CoA oxygenase/reductase subunit PaaK [Herbaspirillum seropedicae]|uniref:Phenylacetic acid degradation NADH oxidoreductase protein n=1 Tax=Herbaspirillum seropedicae (strain SmR1) TaxID=757424 RepID=D8ITG9_HERSS|nr:1,2-phenylacetyl-CoA epoxidase subunit PaaE [Herbaspirillum seropedicae]ADJ65599.1 phenylacetic acid degradation NADH oxidoreductase protein [Herbaspirillum seropedicae SmR1]AKN67418.1 phenylacetic acid degradation protein [Herbaspirillum seropedicae]NQE32009.1 phenylacetic acid degradation protein [Herbaspirillum seropedicae]UMU23427.1 phenylacetate-CoA oxygenase/reductase subunit PaaK [Herbaspirillum seropedicae]
MSKFYPLTISDVKQETRDTIVVSFAVPAELQDTFSYQQGQHLTLRSEINGEDLRRSYSICSAVQERQLRVAIKRAPGGLFSNWANESFVPGQRIDVMPPMGHFNVPLEAGNRKHYLAFAAGSGITPMMSIIKTTLLSEPHSHFTLVYANRASSSVIFKEELTDLKDAYLERFNVVYVMSREQQDVELFNGRIDRAKCDAFFASWIDLKDVDAAFLCGPEEMVQAVAASLQAHGLPKTQIKTELFAASTPPRAHAARTVVGKQECEVTVIVDGYHNVFTMDKEKESVLEAGLKHGIDLRYSCKGGVCATCRCKVVEGKVDMDANYALEDYEIARGFVLSCQSFPVSDKLLLDFDQDN